jgi:diacylglycerol kinase (ATP)
MHTRQKVPAVVLLNTAAGGGRGLKRWAAVRQIVAGTCDPVIVELDAEGKWEAAVRSAVDNGLKRYIAAGGDGTVRALTDALVRFCPDGCLETITMGAVGLGSSNDFHKPIRMAAGGIPMLIGPGRVLRDVCRAGYMIPGNGRQYKYFMVSASIGITADANAFFGCGNSTQTWLRSHWTAGAIFYAALHTIAGYRNQDARLTLPQDQAYGCSITNLTITKTQWLSGHLHYDTPVLPDDGLLTVNLSEGLSRSAAVRLLLDLERGRFLGPPGRRYWRVPHIEAELQGPVELELDGEVYRAQQVTFDIIKEKIGICTG